MSKRSKVYDNMVYFIFLGKSLGPPENHVVIVYQYQLRMCILNFQDGTRQLQWITRFCDDSRNDSV